MPLLANHRHEMFAQAVAGGAEQADAYQSIYETVTRKSAKTEGSRLLSNPIVRARLEELQKMSETATVLSMQERRELLAGRARGGVSKDCDLVNIVLADAKLAGELVEKVDVSGKVTTTPAQVADAVRRSPALRDLALPDAIGNS